MQVAELREALAGRGSITRDVTLEQLEVSNDADRLIVRGGPELPLDEQSERLLATFLGINKTYLAKCPPELKSYNLNWWLQEKANTEAIIEVTGDHLASIHQPGTVLIPIAEVANIIGRVFDPDDEVVKIVRTDDKFQVDVKTDHHIEVRPNPEILGRQVGDITHGGVRITMSPNAKFPPEVRSYFHRLWCTNGSTSPYAESTMRLRATTLQELLRELEASTLQVLNGLDQRLQEYAASADVPVPGSNTDFIYQIAHENGLGERLTDRAISAARGLPPSASVYDILNIFTEMANDPGLGLAKVGRLQSISGDMALNAQRIAHRCSQCERPLAH